MRDQRASRALKTAKMSQKEGEYNKLLLHMYQTPLVIKTFRRMSSHIESLLFLLVFDVFSTKTLLIPVFYLWEGEERRSLQCFSEESKMEVKNEVGKSKKMWETISSQSL